MSARSIIAIDENGVAYINKDLYKTIVKVIVLKSGVDVSDKIQLMSKTMHDSYDNNGKLQKYGLIKFLIPEPSDCYEETNWNDPKVYLKYSQQEKEHRNKLIRDGKIKFR